jgi:alpha-tubulin suppressor-like RCC1 family protein
MTGSRGKRAGLAATTLAAAVLFPALPAAAALPDDGTSGLAWGFNSEGQLGDGTKVQRAIPGLISGMVGGVRQVITAQDNGFAVRSDGTVFAWGDNQAGQLGDGTTTARLTPVQVTGLSSVVQVAGGGGTSIALRSDGTVWTWGDNHFGQLGDGSTRSRSVPAQVSGLSNIIQVDEDAQVSLALRADGTVFAWGTNNVGQLGDGTNTQRRRPVQVLTPSGITQISTGFASALALRSDGTVWAWGNNLVGELGDGTTTSRNVPAQIAGLSGVRQVAANANSMAVLADGTLRGWGNNGSGELGDGTTTERHRPVVVQGISGVSQVRTGGNFTLALRSDGTVWSWGFNGEGQLGDGTTTSHSLPASNGLTNVVQIDASLGDSTAVVAAPTFLLTLGQSGNQAVAGGSVSTQVSLTPLNRFTGSATLSANGLPAGVTASFTPGAVSNGSPATFTLQTATTSPRGTFPITVTASAPAVTKSVTFQLTITSQTVDFAVAVDPGAGSTGAGSTITTQVSLVPLGDGFAGSATLSTGKTMPLGVTASFTPSTVSAGQPATLTLVTSVDSPPDTFEITVFAVANLPQGPTARSTTYLLTIGPPAA